LGGEAATVTDANLVLGRLIPERFLGGELRLDPAAAQRVTDRLGADLGLAPGPARAIEAARAVVRVVNAQMARAIRLVSVERGHDPRGFALVSFGGAGGLHASELARQVGIRTVLIPRFASTLSALGMLVAEPSRDFVRTVMRAGDTSPADLEPEFEPLAREGRRVLAEEGVPPEQIEVERSLDLRYRGQSYELNVAFVGDFTNRFHAAHERAYGYHDPSLPIEIVNLRLLAVGRVDRPALHEEPAGAPDPSAARLGLSAVYLEATDVAGAVPTFDGRDLRSGHQLGGPALVTYPDTTVLLQAGDRAKLDGFRNLLLDVGG
jgi:N-methylhydantoinase A